MAFWDEVTFATQEAQGNKVDESHFIGKWRIIIVRDLPFRDQRLNGKIPKVWNSLGFFRIWFLQVIIILCKNMTSSYNLNHSRKRSVL